MSSKSKARLPREPLTSIRMAFLRPVAKRVASKTPSAAAREPADEHGRVVDGDRRRALAAPCRPSAGVLGRERALLDERLELAGHLGDPLTGDVLGQVDDVGADVAERAGAGLLLVAAATTAAPRGRRSSPGGTARGRGGSRRCGPPATSWRASAIAGTRR